jgi:hypothetical protein
MVEKICNLKNHIATFEYESWGVCGAMVCSWMKTIRNGGVITTAADIGNVGHMILAQHTAMKAADEEAGKLALFRRSGLNLRNKFDFFASGSGARFSPDRLAKATLAPGFSYLSIRWLDDDDEPVQHALGVCANQNEWLLCDPNFFLLRFDQEHEFISSLSSLVSGNGLPPYVQTGPYPVLSATVYYLH